MHKIISILFLFLLLLPSVSAMTTLDLVPSSIDVDVGQTFTVELQITPGEEIDTVATDLITWDKDVLDCLSIEKGNLFNNSLVWIDGTINASGGKIEKMVWGSQYPTSSPGTYITITFKAKKEGYTNIIVDPQWFGVARAGNDIERNIATSCTVKCGDPQSVSQEPINNSGILLITIIAIVITVSIMIAYLSLKRKVKRKENVEKHDEEDIFN